MSPTTHRCTCGATLQFRQDMHKESGGRYPTWKCTDCGTPVPGMIAERLKHQDPF